VIKANTATIVQCCVAIASSGRLSIRKMLSVEGQRHRSEIGRKSMPKEPKNHPRFILTPAYDLIPVKRTVSLEDVLGTVRFTRRTHDEFSRDRILL